MSNIIEEVIKEIVKDVEPLAVEGAVEVAKVVKALVTHQDGAELAARRTLQALEAEAFIRS